MKYQLNKSKTQSFKKFRTIVLLLAVLLVGMGGYRIWQRYTTLHQKADAPNPNQVITVTTNNPAEAKPNEAAEYKVAKDQPKRIMISSISAAGFIQKIGLDKKGAVATPSNVNFAGWYVNSVRPGDEGLSLIDGHVSGKYSDGIFKKLASIKKGDSVRVEFGSGLTKNFEVVSTKQVSETASAKLFYANDPNINNQLNLITCGGKFNKSTQKYSNRVVVVSKLQL